ncbi:hypothetical protein [Halorhabdus amylolytica]|uniref:hypothetical protein n=1 Tax=Halorhabdus amylolytica TaxID=2559573 RepID=UPI0010AAD16E|nr:hypothetical protein [Halorhabdus amylolytica]
MTGFDRKAVLGLVVTVVIVAIGVAGLGGIASGAEEPRDRLGNVSAPVVVFEGEVLNVTEVRQSESGDPIGTGSVSFEGLAGNAEGEFEQADDASRVDFRNFRTGTYDTNGDGRTDVVVRAPVIRSVTVRTQNGANVTGGRIPADAVVDIAAQFNFEAADRIEVSVEDPDGLDVTREVLGSGTARHLTDAEDSVRANFTDQPEGAYRIEVEASELDASRTATVVIRSSRPTIALDRSTVSRGESTIATVIGDPGERVLLRIRSGDLDGVPATDEGAHQVFAASGAVVDRIGSDAPGAVAAVVRLDDRGEGRVRIHSDGLRSDNTARIELVQGTSIRGTSLSRASLRVDRRAVSVTEYPATAILGSELTLTGQARGASTVTAYARIDNRWEPLFRDGSSDRYARADVRSDGRYTLRIDTSRVINARGTYWIAVAADAGEQYDPDQRLSAAEFASLDAESVSIRIGSGELRASLSQPEVAFDTGDEVTLSIETGTDQEDIHLYVVTPRGALQTAETAAVRDGLLERDLGDFTTRGEYRFVVVSRGDDGSFESTPNSVRTHVTGRESQTQLLAKVRDAYTRAGSDDRLRELRLDVTYPRIAIDAPPADGTVEPGDVTVSGTTNRQAGTDVSVEVYRDGTTVTAETTRIGSAGEWQTTLDLAGESAGSYTVRVEVDGTTTQRRFSIDPTTTTTTATATSTTATAETTTDTTTVTTTDAAAETTTGVTETDGQGLTAVLALLAIVAVAALAIRRQT